MTTALPNGSPTRKSKNSLPIGYGWKRKTIDYDKWMIQPRSFRHRFIASLFDIRAMGKCYNHAARP